MKEPFKKHIIILIDTNNMERVMVSFNIHVTNMNRLSKDIKLKISIDFIQTDNKSIIITTNKVVKGKPISDSFIYQDILL